MPIFRDPGGRPVTKWSLIDAYIVDLNRGEYNRGIKPWQDDGIDNALLYVEAMEKAQKEFNERFIEAQRPTRGMF